MLASARSHRVTSVVTVLLILAATATVLVTAGRNAGTEAAVLAQIDAAGTRTLTVLAQGDQPAFTSEVVDRLAAYDVVESVVAFGPVRDATAATNPSATRVALFPVYGALGGVPLSDLPPVAGLPQAWAAGSAADALGMPQGRGSVRVLDGPEYLLTGVVPLPDYLGWLDPAVVEPRSADASDPIASMVVVAASPQDLPLVTRLVGEELQDVPRDGLKLESSQALAELREVVGGELTRQSRGVILGVMAGAALTTLVTIWSLALMRRRDFGRRRALGASRSTIVTLVVGQVALLGVLGAILGAAVGLAILADGGHPLPAAGFVGAVVVALTLVAALASTAPALWASRRDPLTELRVA